MQRMMSEGPVKSRPRLTENEREEGGGSSNIRMEHEPQAKGKAEKGRQIEEAAERARAIIPPTRVHTARTITPSSKRRLKHITNIVPDTTRFTYDTPF